MVLAAFTSSTLITVRTFALTGCIQFLLYLNTLERNQGGETIFASLNVATQPVVGRAVTWVNKNPDGSGHLETNHAAAPIQEGSEKWIVQFWFHAYQMFSEAKSPPQPLVDDTGDIELPAGVEIL